MTRPRAADDFATIRARMEELRRERAQVVAEQHGRSPISPRPYHVATGNAAAHEVLSLLPRLIRRSLVE